MGDTDDTAMYCDIKSIIRYDIFVDATYWQNILKRYSHNFVTT